MRSQGYKLLLSLLRSLVYLKRGLVWVYWKGKKGTQILLKGWNTALGFRIYKQWYLLKNRFKKFIPTTVGGGIVDIFGRRGTLQAVLFIVAVVIMIPQSRLYTRDTQTIAGRKTLLYTLVGPGSQDFQLEEISEDVTAATTYDSRSWRAGAVVSEQGVVEFGAQQIPLQQELSSISAGGGAVTKPTILPGTTLPGAGTPSAASSGRVEIITHTVQSGDTIGGIAEAYGISVETILWANNLTSRSYIRPGDQLIILPVTGVLHQVGRGDTVQKIANTFDAKSEDIIKINRLKNDGSDIAIGEKLIVPGGRKVATYTAPVQSRPSAISSIVAPRPSVETPAGSGYIWPTGVRRITQYYGFRHTGVDIAGPSGTPNYAVKDGVVIKSQCGWNGGYGCYIIVDHGGGVTSLYAHNRTDGLLVSVGESVTQGQVIGLMGTTGRSTGNHLHFEIRVNGARQNPLQYVR